MLMTLFCFLKISINLKNSNIYCLNLQHANIKFTQKIEMNNLLSFLDIKIVRGNNKFSTSVYCKPTFSGVFTNFESFIPTLILMVGFRAGLSGLNLGYPEKPPLKLRKSSWFH